MEDGFYPTYEKTHIVFNMDDNLAVLEYEEGVVSLRLFFSIEKDAFEMFLEASNAMMMESYCAKAMILDDMTNLMFSCEFMCDTTREFRKFFPRAYKMLQEALLMHKAEMKRLVIEEQVAANSIQAADEIPGNHQWPKSRKLLS